MLFKVQTAYGGFQFFFFLPLSLYLSDTALLNFSFSNLVFILQLLNCGATIIQYHWQVLNHVFRITQSSYPFKLCFLLRAHSYRLYLTLTPIPCLSSGHASRKFQFFGIFSILYKFINLLFFLNSFIYR
ncbi:hypothetical protein PPACK8108_LOCUS5176 [Phakopsora pachyrhizi]|uniref:Uncharacterized protein n=1 Tax=Phakopsora pachyrhizi TaxID=170000 RepID=A0AAV0APS1_PHAPC|nr:hypothetical protein PPACK8108_LOCUS5176 [Phakopsora pachyrhizi]